MFSRSPHGIANRSAFTSSDFTVYVENDPNCDPARAFDVAFWREFFQSKFPQYRFTFLPLGGKRHVMIMHERIKENDIKRSLCAIDGDYDSLFGKRDDDNRIFSTFGYGVENDLLSQTSISSLTRAILPGLAEVEDHSREIWSLVNQTVHSERYTLMADQLAALRGAAVLDRHKPQSDIVHNASLPVTLKRTKIRQSVNRARQTPKDHTRHFLPLAKAEFVPAHHYLYIVYHTVTRYISSISRIKINSDVFMAIVVGCIQNNFFHHLNGAIADHYEDLASRNLGDYCAART